MQHTTAIGFTGGRSLNAGQLAQVSGLAASIARSGGTIYTGCAAGADAAAIAGSGLVGGAVVVFAVGAQDGRGFPRPGVPGRLLGASRIIWLAGGPLTVPLVARLARRSLAMVRAVAEAGGSLVAFPASPRPPRSFGPGPFPSCGSGTWSTVAAAALLGVPVFVVSSASPSAVLPVAGAWAPSSLFGVAGWAFVPAQAKAF